MLTTRLLVLIVLWAALGPTLAETWTNQAGRVIEAKLKEFDGAWVTLVRTNTSTLRLPLSALCEADQRRVRAQKAQSIAPAFVKAAYKDAVGIVERFKRLPADQQTAEGREKVVLMACAVFDARVAARSAELTDKDVLDEIRRLRASLVR